jgi:hypothetical protein
MNEEGTAALFVALIVGLVVLIGVLEWRAWRRRPVLEPATDAELAAVTSALAPSDAVLRWQTGLEKTFPATFAVGGVALCQMHLAQRDAADPRHGDAPLELAPAGSACRLCVQDFFTKETGRD